MFYEKYFHFQPQMLLSLLPLPASLFKVLLLSQKFNHFHVLIHYAINHRQCLDQWHH